MDNYIPVLQSSVREMSGHRRIPRATPTRRSISLLGVYKPRFVRPDDTGFKYRPAHVIVAGHSFCKHLERYMSGTYGPHHNLGLSFEHATVEFLYHGGETIKTFKEGRWVEDRTPEPLRDFKPRVKEPKLIFREPILQIITDKMPDIVYLELGSNDISDKKLGAETIASELEGIAQSLISSGIKYVCIGQTIRRKKPQDRWWKEKYPLPDFYNKKVVLMNDILKHLLDDVCTPRAQYWRHVGFWKPTVDVINHADGVHPDGHGLYVLYRSVRGAIIHALGNIDQELRLSD